jgi:multiple sugar transport system substrate-binding protein
MIPVLQGELRLAMTELRGITWDHTRGYLPMVATAQRFSEMHPDVSIRWEKRSLKQFGDLALNDLADQFDLLVVDHPLIGAAAAQTILVPLEQHLPAAFLEDQAANSVGKSNASYIVSGSQYALAIDTAAPVSGWRQDLLDQAGTAVPSTWDDLLELARRGIVAISGVGIDMLMHLYMLCIGLGEEPFSHSGIFASRPVAVRSLEMLRLLAQAVSQEFSKYNPIMVWERLSNGDAEAYCPFAYGYSNYSREGYAAHCIEVGELVSIDRASRCRSTLGGAGLAISSRCRSMETAAEYCQYVAGAACQTRLYFESGGQPGYRAAWIDPEVNRRSRGFFQRTLRTLDEAWLRPRWNGYHKFQDEAALLVHQYAWHGGDAGTVASSLNELASKLRRAESARGGR